MRALASSLCLLAVLWTAACARSPRAAYLAALDEQTELLMVYRDMGTALRLRGTYLSPAFREVLAAERARLVEPSAADHDAWTARLRRDGEDYHEVIFTAETALIDTRLRFGTDDEGWQVRLLADGVEEELVTVRRVDRPGLLDVALYAHKNKFNELFVARFRRTVAAPAEVVFKVGSGFGHGELRFSGAQVVAGG